MCRYKKCRNLVQSSFKTFYFSSIYKSIHQTKYCTMSNSQLKCDSSFFYENSIFDNIVEIFITEYSNVWILNNVDYPSVLFWSMCHATSFCQFTFQKELKQIKQSGRWTRRRIEREIWFLRIQGFMCLFFLVVKTHLPDRLQLWIRKIWQWDTIFFDKCLCGC